MLASWNDDVCGLSDSTCSRKAWMLSGVESQASWAASFAVAPAIHSDSRNRRVERRAVIQCSSIGCNRHPAEKIPNRSQKMPTYETLDVRL